MKNLIGDIVVLRTMAMEEVAVFYKWAVQSPFWYGEFSDESIPTYEKFREDFPDYYFDGSLPDRGGAFSIVVDDRVIGEINYEITKEDRSAELDILIYQEKDRGKGYGSDAEEVLSRWLLEEMDVDVVFIVHNAKNVGAIKASQKAGFKNIKTYSHVGMEWIRLELRKR